MIDTPLTRRDRAFIALLAVLSIAFGVVVELRSAYMQRRHTDLGPPLRAAWAIRAGVDPYAVTDDGGLHYPYPILHAILLTPFADAPPGEPQPRWAVPYPVSVALWYVVSLAFLFWSVHHLSRVLDETRPDGTGPPPAWSRRFWWTRCWPLWICLPAIGSTLSRGQVNLMLLALLSGFIADVLHERRGRAGWWLAAATVLKVIPALLVLYPLVRRDWRMLGHYTLGLVAGLIVVPSLVLGPERAFEANRTYVTAILRPGVTNEPGPLSRELTNVNASDNQSIRAIIHNVFNWDRATRPEVASTGTKLAHVLIGLALLAWTFHAARRIPDARYRTFFLLGGLVILMVAISPANHTHYMVLGLPVVLGLVYREMERRGSFAWGVALIAVVALHVVSGTLPRLPGFEPLRDLGVTMLGTLVLWYAGLRLPAAGAPSGTRPTGRAAPLPVPSVRVLK